MGKDVLRLSRLLAESGVSRGDKVAILSTNMPKRIKGIPKKNRGAPCIRRKTNISNNPANILTYPTIFLKKSKSFSIIATDHLIFFYNDY